MAVDLHTNDRPTPEVGVGSVIKGVLDDIQKLYEQQLAMLRAEIKADWHKTKNAIWPFVAGGSFGLAGVVLLSFMLVHGIHSLAGQGDPAALPLWACFGLVGGVFAVMGAVLVYLGIARFQSFNPLPDESARALGENMRWLTKDHS